MMTPTPSLLLLLLWTASEVAASKGSMDAFSASSLSEMGGYADVFRSWPLGSLTAAADDDASSSALFVGEPHLPLQQQQQQNLPIDFNVVPSINPLRRYLYSSSLPRLLENENQDENHGEPSSTNLFPTSSHIPRVTANLPYHWFHHHENEGDYTIPIKIHDKHHENYKNKILDSDSMSSRIKKTGTTIAGICGDGFCVLGADTRATESNGGGTTLVADTRAAKLHWLTQSVVAAGAGTSADLQHLCLQTAISLAMLYEITVGNPDVNIIPIQSSGSSSPGTESSSSSTTPTTTTPPPYYLARRVHVHTVCRMLQDALLRRQGAVQAYLIVGGVDADTGQASLRALHPHGSMDQKLAYTALGSGGYAAMGILESRYRPDLTQEQAVALVRDAIAAGIQNDMGSGSQIDLCIMSSSSSSNSNGEGCCVQYMRSQAPIVNRADAKKKQNQEKEDSSASSSTSVGINGFGGKPIVIQLAKTLYDDQLRGENPDQQWQDFLDAKTTKDSLR